MPDLAPLLINSDAAIYTKMWIIPRSFMPAVYYSQVIYAIGLLFPGHLCKRFIILRSFYQLLIISCRPLYDI